MRSITFLLLFYPTIVLGQLSSKLRCYYTYINKAELALLDSAYPQAASHYSAAFQKKKFPFEKDILNAMVCNALIGNYPRSYDYGEELLKRGLGIHFLQKKLVLKPFFDSDYGIRLEQKSKTISMDKKRKALHAAWDSIHSLDQEFRKIEPDYHKGIYLDTIRKIDSSNVLFFQKFIRKYGFPCEKLIGLDDSDLLFKPYSIVLLHQAAGATNRMYNFHKSLSNSFYQGKQSNRYATYMMDVCNGSDNYGNRAASFYYYVYDSTGSLNSAIMQNIRRNRATLNWTYEKLDPEREKMYNKLREEVGLESITEFRRKLKYWLKDQSRTFEFGLIGGCQINGIMDKQLYESIVKSMIPVN